MLSYQILQAALKVTVCRFIGATMLQAGVPNANEGVFSPDLLDTYFAKWKHSEGAAHNWQFVSSWKHPGRKERSLLT